MLTEERDNLWGADVSLPARQPARFCLIFPTFTALPVQSSLRFLPEWRHFVIFLCFEHSYATLFFFRGCEKRRQWLELTDYGTFSSSSSSVCSQTPPDELIRLLQTRGATQSTPNAKVLLIREFLTICSLFFFPTLIFRLICTQSQSLQTLKKKGGTSRHIEVCSQLPLHESL